MELVRTISRCARRCNLLLFAGALLSSVLAPASPSSLIDARDRQDLKALDVAIQRLRADADRPHASATADYDAALAYSYASEVAMELHDKHRSAGYAELGIEFARKAVAGSESDAEYHRLLGEMCGQIIPANPLMGALKYGQCARDELNKAIQLDPNLALAYVSRGVGNYYLPSSMGGGPEVAIKDFQKAISINPRLAEAYLWQGLALRKEGRNADARQSLEHALQLDPHRVWIKQEIEKTPAH